MPHATDLVKEKRKESKKKTLNPLVLLLTLSYYSGPISSDRESMKSFVKGGIGIKIETETHRHSGEHPRTAVSSDEDHKQIETHKGIYDHLLVGLFCS